MRSNNAVIRRLVVTPQPDAEGQTLQPLSEAQAAEAMWQHYRVRKEQLISDIREYRAGILAELMRGVPAERAFAPYVKPLETAQTLRRAA